MSISSFLHFAKLRPKFRKELRTHFVIENISHFHLYNPSIVPVLDTYDVLTILVPLLFLGFTH